MSDLKFALRQLLKSPGFSALAIVTLALGQSGLDTPARPEIYFPLSQAPKGADPGLPLFHLETLQGVIADSVADRRVNSALLGTFAVALMLAAMGLYGVISYAVTQRTREFGIRIALGAKHGNLYRLVIGRGMKLASLGLALGLLATVGLTRFLASLLYGVRANDPLTFAAVITGLGGMALFANFFPARRAAAVSPIVALRYE